MKKFNLMIICLYLLLFIVGTWALFHGFPDINRFFGEWMDEGAILTYIMKFGTLNFAPKTIMHPPLYYYITFIPIGMFFVIGKLMGFFYDKVDFVRFYFNNTHYFLFIARTMSYIFYWLTAVMIFKIVRLFYDRKVAHITTFTFLLIPTFIGDFSTTRPETLLFLNCSIFFYFFLKFYLDNKKIKFLFLSALFLGISTATKYNALFLGAIFIPTLLFQIKNRDIKYKSYKRILFLILCVGFFIFLGFFICNPFFIIKFRTYFYNLIKFDTVRIQYYHRGYWPAIFFITHMIHLSSSVYLNFFGFLILILGFCFLFKKVKRLFPFLFLPILVFEIYFGIYHRLCSPTYFLNPLLPIAALIFSIGVDFILRLKNKFQLILIAFLSIAVFNYFEMLISLSSKPTYTQEARAFIENHIPEFTNICIASNTNMPQLNMTRQSYFHLIQTAPTRNDKGHELDYREMDNEENYDRVFRELRIESLLKKPQFNLIRWDKSIKDKEGAVLFFKENNIKYLISNSEFKLGNMNLEDEEILSLIREFKAKYNKVYKERRVFLYKVNPMAF